MFTFLMIIYKDRDQCHDIYIKFNKKSYKQMQHALNNINLSKYIWVKLIGLLYSIYVEFYYQYGGYLLSTMGI
jgi:hypothetical protein